LALVSKPQIFLRAQGFCQYPRPLSLPRGPPPDPEDVRSESLAANQIAAPADVRRTAFHLTANHRPSWARGGEAAMALPALQGRGWGGDRSLGLCP
jgi:hypothetical protein